MKKTMVILLAVVLAVGIALADVVEKKLDVYFGETKLDVAVFSDGKSMYVDLQQLIEALGGTYEEQKDKIVFTIDLGEEEETVSEAIPTEISEVPSVSWEYVNYVVNECGYDNAEMWMQDFYYGADEMREKVTALINTVIEKSDDVDAFAYALNMLVQSGGYFTEPLEKLAK